LKFKGAYTPTKYMVFIFRVLQKKMAYAKISMINGPIPFTLVLHLDLDEYHLPATQFLTKMS
jgi:hypothetical protein